MPKSVKANRLGLVALERNGGLMDIAAMEENRIEPEFDAAIRDGLCRVFPDDAAHFFLHRAWHGSAPSFSVVAYEKVHG
ncbi:MAG: hypothetical protein LIP23_02160, partial [Planctomycetes bacterium]|nr:hypothetical protein [Planctomycetota bacterium]